MKTFRFSFCRRQQSASAKRTSNLETVTLAKKELLICKKVTLMGAQIVSVLENQACVKVMTDLSEPK